jgi:large subunit ribosomal protein L25
MTSPIQLTAEVRQQTGTVANRRLRRNQEKVPAVIYGAGKAPSLLAIEQRFIRKAAKNPGFQSQVIELDIAGKVEQVLVKELQQHPAKGTVLHIDFLRVSAKQKLQVKVPLHFINEESCIGVKEQGGTISHQLTEVEVSCLASDLPQTIEVDMGQIELGRTLHLTDLNLPKSVELVELTHGADHDLPVASVQAQQTQAAEESEPAATEETSSKQEESNQDNSN